MTAMLDWNAYRDQVQARIGNLAKLSPETVHGYSTLSGAAAKTGHLDAKTRELIALAVAVTTRCDGCITVHVEDALREGASREEIAEVLGGGGSAQRRRSTGLFRPRHRCRRSPPPRR